MKNNLNRALKEKLDLVEFKFKWDGIKAKYTLNKNIEDVSDRVLEGTGRQFALGQRNR